MKLYESDWGWRYLHSDLMYCQPETAPLLLKLATTPPLKDGSRYPWKKRGIRPFVPAGKATLFWPVLSEMFFAHRKNCPYVSLWTSAPLGRYWSARRLATMM